MKKAEGSRELDGEIDKGRKIVGLFLTRNREMESHELFKRAWHLILENENYFRGISEIKNRFNVSWQSKIYKQFLFFFKEAVKPGFNPLACGVGPDFITAGDRGALFMSVHSDLELGAVKFLQQQGHAVSLMASRRRPDPQRINKRLFSLAEPVDIIWRQNDSLLQIRQALRASRTVIVNVDYTLFDQDQQLHVRRASRAFLKTAARLGVPLYWILPFVGPDGEIACCSKRVISETTPREKLQLLDSLAKQHGIALGELILGDWFKETAGKSQALLPKNSENPTPGLSQA